VEGVLRKERFAATGRHPNAEPALLVVEDKHVALARRAF
jgi:hypothetical protein